MTASLVSQIRFFRRSEGINRGPTMGALLDMAIAVEVKQTVELAQVGLSPLTPAQASARAQVLRELERRPELQRAFATRFEDGNLIVTLGLRGVGTAQLCIRADRFDAKSILHFGELGSCLTFDPFEARQITQAGWGGYALNPPFKAVTSDSAGLCTETTYRSNVQGESSCD
jgi:hypothetical protein